MFKVIILIFVLLQPAAAEDDYGPDPVYIDPYEYGCGGDNEPEPETKIEVRYVP